MAYVVNLDDYYPPKRFPPVVTPWTQAQISYSPDGIVAYTVLVTQALTPLDADLANPLQRNFTVTNAPTPAGWLVVTFLDGSGNQAPTDPVQYPAPQGHGAASSSVLAARYAVRHRIRDGMPLLDPNPVPFNVVRLEELTDQIGIAATPTQTTFQVRFDDVPTGRYVSVQAVPGTLVAFVDGSWTPTTPTADVDANGNFSLPVPPVSRLMVTYAYQLLSDGEIDQFVDQARQWLREFTYVSDVPDGLVPALTSYASALALGALARSVAFVRVRAGDSDVDWSALAKAYMAEAEAAEKTARAQREEYYSMGPEALSPGVIDVSAPIIGPYTPER